MADEVFMSLLPRDNEYSQCIIESIPLRVVQEEGIEYNADIKFTTTDLNGGRRHFKNNSGDADSFTITVLLNINDTVNLKELLGYNTVFLDVATGEATYYDPIYKFKGKTENLIKLLDYYIREGIPFYVHTRAIGIDNQCLWLVTGQKSRKQTNDIIKVATVYGVQESGYVAWDLTFTKYNELVLSNFKNTNAVVQKAIQQFNNKKSKTAKKKTTTAKTKTTIYQKLAKCDYKKLVYSKTKKTTSCIKTMQEILYKDGSLKGKKSTVVDGWFGDKTKEAVKAYQKKYAKRDSLKQNGKVDKATFNSLCGQVGKTKTIKSNLPTANKNGVIDMTKK